MAEDRLLSFMKYPEDGIKHPVAKEIDNISKTVSDSKKLWQIGMPNRIGAEHFLNLLLEKAYRLKEMRQSLRDDNYLEEADNLRSPTVDVLVFGQEISLYVGKHFVCNLLQTFPWLNAEAISSNEILTDLQSDLENLNLGQETIVLVISQSGQTFPTVKAMDKFEEFRQQGKIREVFLLVGSVTSILSHPVLNRENFKTLPNNLFINGSSHSTCEPASVTVNAVWCTLNELVLYLSKRFVEEFPDANSLGTILTPEDIAKLEKRGDDNVVILEKIVGIDTAGNRIQSRIHSDLVFQANKWAQHILEKLIAWGLVILYIMITVGLKLTPTQAIFDLLVASFELSQGSLVFLILFACARGADIIIYILLHWFFTLGLRLLQGRELLARTGTRSLLISAVPHVGKPLEAFATKTVANSYELATWIIHEANPVNDQLDRQAHRTTRGKLVIVSVPDGRYGNKLRLQEEAAIMTAKQTNNIRNLRVGPEIIAFSPNSEIEKERCFKKVFLLPSVELDLNLDGPNASKRKELIASLSESMFGELECFTANIVLLGEVAKIVASFFPLEFEYHASQSRTKTMTTASPVKVIFFLINDLLT